MFYKIVDAIGPATFATAIAFAPHFKKSIAVDGLLYVPCILCWSNIGFAISLAVFIIFSIEGLLYVFDAIFKYLHLYRVPCMSPENHSQTLKLGQTHL